MDPQIVMHSDIRESLSSRLAPIIKWPGGKEKELKYILPAVPPFHRYFDPFVGGGAVFMAVEAEAYCINDYSTELVELYQKIHSSDASFFDYAEMMDHSWQNAHEFFKTHQQLLDIYLDYRNRRIDKEKLKEVLHALCQQTGNEVMGILAPALTALPSVLQKEMEKNLYRKMVRMRELEIRKHLLPEKDLGDNIETAIKSAVYMNYRFLYNSADITASHPSLRCALFFFIRNYAYSGMFRYNSKGLFNVPYGGIAYNSKMMSRKLDYYRSPELLEHFSRTTLYNEDFEQFLRKVEPEADDFVFLDPPYDSEFSTYARNAFTREDQKRLANYLTNDCRAKWMMVIKNTEFIHSLYQKEGIHIRSFDKEYTVSFKNRNDRRTTHLVITNY